MVLSRMNNHEYRTKQTYESYTFQPLMSFCNHLSNVLPKNQWGYRKGVSTESLLLYLTETWKINIDHGNVVGVIFIDFRKAFETVYHEVLFYKMQACGFYRNVLQWRVSYLKNRKQFVEPNGAKSQLYFVSHGVPQGSLLGRRLFFNIP